MDGQFIIKSDGTFRAYMGDVILKAQKVGDTEGWHFNAIASTGDKDRENETLLQKGLNFEPFADSGEFNWNHIPHAMIGVPVGKKAWFEKGHWCCEGMIIADMPVAPGYTTNQIVTQHNQLRKSGFPRGLCTSVEGKVRERSDDGKYVIKADIYNIALTFRPVNPNCTLSMLAKSMDKQAELSVDNEFYKALSVSDAAPFAKEDLEGGSKNSMGLEGKLVKHLCRKGYSEGAAKAHVARFMKKKFLGVGSKR
jgi:hypothetical protein